MEKPVTAGIVSLSTKARGLIRQALARPADVPLTRRNCAQAAEMIRAAYCSLEQICKEADPAALADITVKKNLFKKSHAVRLSRAEPSLPEKERLPFYLNSVQQNLDLKTSEQQGGSNSMTTHEFYAFRLSVAELNLEFAEKQLPPAPAPKKQNDNRGFHR